MLVTYNPVDVEYYESAQAFLEDNSRIEVDIHIIGLKGKFRIGALTFGQMEKINRMSLVDGSLDSVQFSLNTIKEGVIRPKFTKKDLEDLLDYSGEIVRELSNQIWQLGRITKETFDLYINAAEEKEDKKVVVKENE